VKALRAQDVRCILLKGPALERWLYDGELRSYVDVDLLVSPDDWSATEAVLVELGYERGVDDKDIPPFDRPLHAYAWIAPREPSVDLHRTLPGAAASEATVWLALGVDTELLEVDGTKVEVLAPPARAVLVALHAAHHGAGERKPLEDLSRALERVDRATWDAAARIARRLDAVDAFGAGLRLLPAGRRLATELALPPTVEPEVALRADPPEPLAIHLEWLRQADGTRAKAALMLRLLFPPRAYMEPPPGTPRRRVALARAYLARLAKLRDAPAALSDRRRRKDPDG
jgi:hypothetical protein